MLIGGISFGEKTIWDEIAANIKAAELEMDKAFDRIKEESEGDEEPDEVNMLVESLLNYKDVLEGKVRDLEQENEKLHAEIDRQDELVERLEKNDGSVMYNQLLGNTEGEARELFVRHCFYNLKCVPINSKCDCGNLKKKIEELQSEVRDLTAENVKLVTMNNHLKNAIHIKEQGNIIADKSYEELKEKYETADLEREHLKTELDRIKGTKKELEAALMATIGTVQRLSAELVKTGKE